MQSFYQHINELEIPSDKPSLSKRIISGRARRLAKALDVRKSPERKQDVKYAQATRELKDLGWGSKNESIRRLIEKKIRLRKTLKLPNKHIDKFVEGKGRPIEIDGKHYGGPDHLVIPGENGEPIHVATRTPNKPTRHIIPSHNIDLHSCPESCTQHQQHYNVVHKTINSRAMDMQAQGKGKYLSSSGSIRRGRAGQTGQPWGMKLSGAARFTRRTGEPPPQHPIEPNPSRTEVGMK
tara:strand:+ start:401 stop:1111 length:711 start_codon:yes stop_codon:yes gene_type:complete